jgi:hypothetical protein
MENSINGRISKIKIGLIALLIVACSGIGTTTQNHEIHIKNETYFVRATIGGVGGTYLYSIGKTKRSGWSVNKKHEMYLKTNDLSGCYFLIKEDTLHFFSNEKLTIPENMRFFPVTQHPLPDTVNYTHPIPTLSYHG